MITQRKWRCLRLQMKFAVDQLPTQEAVLKRCSELESKVNAGKGRDGPVKRLGDTAERAALDMPSRVHYARYTTASEPCLDPAGATHTLYPCVSGAIDVRLSKDKGRQWVAGRNIAPGAVPPEQLITSKSRYHAGSFDSLPKTGRKICQICTSAHTAWRTVYCTVYI